MASCIAAKSLIINISLIFLYQSILYAYAQNCTSDASKNYALYTREFSYDDFDCNFTANRALVGPISGYAYIFINAKENSNDGFTYIESLDIDMNILWSVTYGGEHAQYSPAIHPDEGYLFYITIDILNPMLIVQLGTSSGNVASAFRSYINICRDVNCRVVANSNNEVFFTALSLTDNILEV